MIIQSTIDTLKAMRFSAMAGELEKNLQELWKDGTLKALSQKYFEKDITLKLQEKK